MSRRYRSSTSATLLVRPGIGIPPTLTVFRGTPNRIAIEQGFTAALRQAGVTTTLVDATTLTHAQVNHRIGARRPCDDAAATRFLTRLLRPLKAPVAEARRRSRLVVAQEGETRAGGRRHAAAGVGARSVSIQSGTTQLTRTPSRSRRAGGEADEPALAARTPASGRATHALPSRRCSPPHRRSAIADEPRDRPRLRSSVPPPLGWWEMRLVTPPSPFFSRGCGPLPPRGPSPRVLSVPAVPAPDAPAPPPPPPPPRPPPPPPPRAPRPPRPPPAPPRPPPPPPVSAAPAPLSSGWWASAGLTLGRAGRSRRCGRARRREATSRRRAGTRAAPSCAGR